MNQNFYENEAAEGAIRQSIEHGLGFRLLLGCGLWYQRNPILYKQAQPYTLPSKVAFSVRAG